MWWMLKHHAHGMGGGHGHSRHWAGILLGIAVSMVDVVPMGWVLVALHLTPGHLGPLWAWFMYLRCRWNIGACVRVSEFFG